LGVSQIDLVGYSMGSIVALIVASREPRVGRLIVGGIGESAVILGGIDSRVLPFDAIAEAMLAEDPATIQHPAVQGIRAFVDMCGSDPLALAAQARVFHATPIALKSITAPTLVIVGNQDPLAQRPEVLVDAIADARLAIKSGDHTGVASDPTFTPTLVDFLCQS
jgi:pimeloyl-ACP methyl ester carboxylesterase